MRTALLIIMSLLLCSVSWAGELSPQEMKEIEASKEEARLLFSRGEYEKALPLLERILEMDPGNRTAKRYMLILNRQIIEPYCKEAADAFLAGDYPNAISAWEEILKINPRDKRVAGLIDESMTLSEDNTIQSLYASVNALLKEGRMDLAIVELEKILTLQPDDARARDMLQSTRRILTSNTIKKHFDLADMYLQQKEFDMAIEELERILEIDPSQEVATRLIVSAQERKHEAFYDNVKDLIKRGEREAAISELERILVLYPNERRASELLQSTRLAVTDTAIKEHYDKAEAYAREKKYDLAIDQWKKILEIDPSQDLASRKISSVQRQKLDETYSRASRLYHSGDYMAARDAYSSILAENPTDQKIKATVERLNETIKVVPQLRQEGQVWDVLRKGLAHHISADGNPKVTVAAAWYAAQMEPDDTLVLSVRDFVESRHIAVIRTMETPVKDMNLVEQYLFASLNHIYEGRYDLAILECGLVLELEPDNVLALKRLGSAYFALGRKEKARKAWQKALSSAPEDGELKEFIRQAM